MKRVALVFFGLIVFIILLVFTSKVLVSPKSEAETIVHQYIENIRAGNWNEYVELFHYDAKVKEDLLSFLHDEEKQAEKEGIHTILDIKLVSMEATSDPEFNSKGDEVYDVLLDMKVHKPSEFYENGVSRHIFVFNRTGKGLQLETVYYKGLAKD